MKSKSIKWITLCLSVGCMLMATWSCSKSDNISIDSPEEPIPVLGMHIYAPDTSDYVLKFMNNDPDMDTLVREKLVAAFFDVYPREAAHFNPQSLDTVVFSMDTSYDGVAATGGGKVSFSAAYFHEHPTDIDVVTHEVMHIVQSYPHYDPVWLVEGVADYARAVYGVDNAGAGWTLPDYNDSQNYTDSYRVTARFLLWLEKNKEADFVEQLDHALRGDTYTEQTWSDISGASVDELWAAYGAAPPL